jgi:hypothetical protein
MVWVTVGGGGGGLARSDNPKVQPIERALGMTREKVMVDFWDKLGYPTPESRPWERPRQARRRYVLFLAGMVRGRGRRRRLIREGDASWSCLVLLSGGSVFVQTSLDGGVERAITVLADHAASDTRRVLRQGSETLAFFVICWPGRRDKHAIDFSSVGPRVAVEMASSLEPSLMPAAAMALDAAAPDRMISGTSGIPAQFRGPQEQWAVLGQALMGFQHGCHRPPL